MARIILVTGGARSGKSRYAESRAESLTGNLLYVATAEAWDAEMRERISEHRARRGHNWQTREVPLDLPGVLSETDGEAVRLVDCLTLWLSNLIHAGHDPAREGALLIDVLRQQASPVILVTNEVGLGIVPENALARRFRDAAGRLNQAVGEAADDVVLVVAGQPLTIKPAG